jgi:hypothetical protein
VNTRPVTRPDQTGRMRAERAFPPEPCAVCGAAYSKTGANVGRHHADGDRLNNTRENIVFLCKRHHIAAHRALDGRIGGGPRPRVAEMQRQRARSRYLEAAAMRDSGCSTVSIAASLGVDRKTVTRWFQKYAESVR